MTARNQEGHIFEVRNSAGKVISYHLRYRQNELQSDGKIRRVLKSQKLADKDDRYHSIACAALRAKQREIMTRINLQAGTAQQDVLITDFWANTYLPHLQFTKKPQTMDSYLKIWNRHLSPAFAGVRLREFTCARATIFLTSLVKDKKLGRRSLENIRSLALGLFRHAKQLDLAEQNPFADAQSHVKPPTPEATHWYSLEEAETIFNALNGHLQAQLIFVLATFMGLRPGEIAALRWEDISEDLIHVRRSSWRGNVGTTKTPESVASVPMIDLVRNLVNAWRTACVVSEGWVFPSRKTGGPLDMGGFSYKHIGLILKKKKIAWKGLYSGRRAAATLLVHLTGNAIAAQYVLRRKNMATTTAFYIKPSREDAVTGMKLVEGELAEKYKFVPQLTAGEE